MQVTETQNEGLKRSYNIILPAAELDAKVNEKLAEAQPQVAMKGFRKGKVPIALLKKQHGQRLMGEAMQEAIDGAMREHFEETGDRPAAQPEVRMTNENWSEGDDIEVAMSYEKLPQIPETDLRGLELDRMVVKARDEDVDDALKSLSESARSFVDREEGAPAENGDQVIIDFTGRIDGEPFEGGEAEDHALTLGSESFIPGFEEQLVGARVGETPQVTVSFPADYGAERLAGRTAVFDTKVKAVKKPVPVEIDDALAQQYGAEDLATLRGQIAERLETEYANAARGVTKRQLLDKLDERVLFELPPSMVEAEAGQIAHQLWHEENPDVEGHEHGEEGHEHGEVEVTDEHRRLAERRVKLGLLLAELGRQNEIEVTDQEMTQAVMNQARQYPGREREFLEVVQKNEQMQQQIRAPLFEDKVIDYIFELANVSEREVSKEELQKAVEEMEEE